MVEQVLTVEAVAPKLLLGLLHQLPHGLNEGNRRKALANGLLGGLLDARDEIEQPRLPGARVAHLLQVAVSALCWVMNRLR